MKQIRIEWKIGDSCGHGSWFPGSDIKVMDDIVSQANKIHGDVTHWLAEDNNGWIDASINKPPLIEGKDYSANVWGWDGYSILVVEYVKGSDGWYWANCYGDVFGVGEIDDDYDIKYWQPIIIPDAPK